MAETAKIQIAESTNKSGLKGNAQSTMEKPKTSHGGEGAANRMTERERLQASLRQTLTEFKEQQSKEKRNG